MLSTHFSPWLYYYYYIHELKAYNQKELVFNCTFLSYLYAFNVHNSFLWELILLLRDNLIYQQQN